MFTRDIGVDLGTANTLVCVKGKGIIMREPSVVAYDIRNDAVRAVGTEAKEMIGRTPGSIVAVRPLKDGVIADFDVTAAMLKRFIRQALKGSVFSRVRMVVCIPAGVTEVESRAVYDAAKQAGATDVDLVEEPMAAAVGAGLPVWDAAGSMVVDVGGGTSEVAIISLGGIVTSTSLRVAGDALDSAIARFKTICDVTEGANFIRDEMISRMTVLRSAADEAETLTAESAWPFPTYGDLMFSVR